MTTQENEDPREVTATDELRVRVDELRTALTLMSPEKYKGSSGKKRLRFEHKSVRGRSADGVRRHVVQHFDRAQDATGGWYEKLVTDEATDEVHYHLREWIAFHRGRGADKKKSYRTPYEWAVDSMASEERPKVSP